MKQRTAVIEEIVSGTNPDCGCYEEVCTIFPFEVTLHFEADGMGEAFFSD